MGPVISLCRGAVLVVAVVAAAACGATTEPRAPGTASVVSIVDGDTVVIDVDGTHERVRLLGIDTPETSHPTRPVECFGAESTARITELIPPGSAVRVERDVEARDHYGRLLLYLYRADDDLFVNHALVAEGYAATLHIDPNGAHRGALSAAEQEARATGLGLWGACGGPDVAIDPLASR
jgi:micrococcal nuclease